MKKKPSGRAEAVRLLKKDGSVDRSSPQEIQFAVNYLTFFGYIAVELLKYIDLNDIKSAVRKFQEIFGIRKTGELTPETIRAMQRPRCGCPDQLDVQNSGHRQFMVAQEISAERRDRWNKSGLTYMVEQYIDCRISKTEQDRIFAEAFLAWDNVCGLNITRTKKNADIVVTTGQGPQNKFDGKGGTLAWAYMPTGNDQQLTVRFDADETWVAKAKEPGILLSNVACHEFGHLIGLVHSEKPTALMAPFYNPFVNVPQHDDDRILAEKLYGKNTQVAAIDGVAQVGDNIMIEMRPGQHLTVVCK